jgi:hypothetical protein
MVVMIDEMGIETGREISAVIGFHPDDPVDRRE